jgi:hypothetical protein
VCGTRAVTNTRNARKRAISIDTDMLQLQICGWSGTSFLHISRLQVCQGRDAKENVADCAQDYDGKDVLFQPQHPRTILRGGATQQQQQQQQQPQPPSVAQACPATVGEMSATLPLRHNQQEPNQSVQSPNANISSLHDIFTVVATVLQ